MAPKKGAKKKKKASSTTPAFEFSPATSAQVTQARLPPYVRVRWPAVPVSMTVSSIKQAIIKRHGGSVYDVSVWKDVVRLDSRIKEEDQGLSLRALGVQGMPQGDADQLPVFTLHYDFEPVLFDDPIASITCQTRDTTIDLKAYLRMHRH